MITFTVGTGTSKIIFKVHGQPACQQSPFINNEVGDNEKWATFRGGYHFKVDYVDTDTFRLFIQYLYSRKITLPFHKFITETTPNQPILQIIPNFAVNRTLDLSSFGT